MEKQNELSASYFTRIFEEFLPSEMLSKIFRLFAPKARRPALLTPFELVSSMVFHMVVKGGTLAQHVNQLTNTKLSDSALSQRRSKLPLIIFTEILEKVLTPKADPQAHPDSFHEGYRLVGIDGSLFSVANTPDFKQRATKATTRRKKAAFAKVGMATLMELGTHFPIGASIGPSGQSEMVLAESALRQLPPESLLIADRYYGVPSLLIKFKDSFPDGDRAFLVRVRSNIKCLTLETYPDGSALVEIGSGKNKMLVREVISKVRRGKKTWSIVRLWTSLLDWRKHPATTLLRLYGKRWEHEIAYKEMKVDMRNSELLQCHTVETAAQEIATLILAYAVMAKKRLDAGEKADEEVLRISFQKILELVRGLWWIISVSEDVLSEDQIEKLVLNTFNKAALLISAKRRNRSCPRALRQPVSSRPRLLKNTYEHGTVVYEVIPPKAVKLKN